MIVAVLRSGGRIKIEDDPEVMLFWLYRYRVRHHYDAAEAENIDVDMPRAIKQWGDAMARESLNFAVVSAAPPGFGSAAGFGY